MEPANTIIDALGGPTAVAKIVGVHRTRVSMWKVERRKGGSGGLIPMKHAVVLLAAAEAQGIEIAAEDFFPAKEGVA